MSEVKWLGPYEPETRHADPVTINHIIELRKKLAEAERQRDNVMAHCLSLHDEVWKLRMKIVELGGHYDEEDRNC